jgi:hypothetical protein
MVRRIMVGTGATARGNARGGSEQHQKPVVNEKLFKFRELEEGYKYVMIKAILVRLSLVSFRYRIFYNYSMIMIEYTQLNAGMLTAASTRHNLLSTP